MINADIRVEGIEELEKKLGNMKSKAPVVLSRAINRAASKAKTELKSGVNADYIITKGEIEKTLTIQRASAGSLAARLKSKGGPIALSKFKTLPTKPTSQMKRKPAFTRAQVERNGSPKPLTGEPKAFISDMASGHRGVMERTGPRRLPLKQLYGPAIPSMAKNEKVMEQVKESASRTLEERIDHEVSRILGGN